MGIKGFWSYFDRSDLKDLFFERINCNNSTLIVDGLNLMFYLIDNVEVHEDGTCIDRRQLGTYYEFRKILTREVRKLQSLGFNLVFYFDGLIHRSLFKRLSAIDNYLPQSSSWKKLYNCLLYKKTTVAQKTLPSPELTRLVMEQVLTKELGLNIHIYEEGEADIGISRFCRELLARGQSAYIYSNDTDLAIMRDCRLINIGEFTLPVVEYARVYTRQKVGSILGLSDTQVVEFAILLGTDFNELVRVYPDSANLAEVFDERLSFIRRQPSEYRVHPLNPKHVIQEVILNYCRNFYNVTVTDDEARLRIIVDSMGRVEDVRVLMSTWDNIPLLIEAEEEYNGNDNEENEEDEAVEDLSMIPHIDVHAFSAHIRSVVDQPLIRSLGNFVLQYLSTLPAIGVEIGTAAAVPLLHIMIYLLKKGKRIADWRYAVRWEYATVAYCYQRLLRHALESQVLPYYDQLQSPKTSQRVILDYFDGATLSWLALKLENYQPTGILQEENSNDILRFIAASNNINDGTIVTLVHALIEPHRQQQQYADRRFSMTKWGQIVCTFLRDSELVPPDHRMTADQCTLFTEMLKLLQMNSPVPAPFNCLLSPALQSLIKSYLCILQLIINTFAGQYATDINECGGQEGVLQRYCMDIPTFCFLVEVLGHVTQAEDDNSIESIQVDQTHLNADNDTDDEEALVDEFYDEEEILSSSLIANALTTSEENLFQLEQLPVDAYALQILDEVSRHHVTLIRGDTGCGKSSRIPVIIAQAALASSQPCRILVCEPKQLAARALYTRVDKELAATDSNISVALRLSNRDQKGLVDTANITYSATRYICKLHSPNINQLSEYTHIIVDEVHERTFENDMLCLLLKTLLHSAKSKVKVLLLSATVDYGLYQDYFISSATAAEAEVVSVSTEPLYVGGTRFPCEFYHIGALSLESSNLTATSLQLQNYASLQTDIFQAWCATIARECDVNNIVLRPTTIGKQMKIAYSIINELRSRLMGHTVLIFVPSLTEISTLSSLFTQDDNESGSSSGKVFDIFQIVSDLSNTEQVRILSEISTHKIRIIIATKIAESSITLPSVKAVIDFGIDEVEVYDNNQNFTWQTRTNRWITKTSATQRAGRAGRTVSGYVFRLYTEEQAQNRLSVQSECDTNRRPLHELVLSALLCHNGCLPDTMLLSQFFGSLITPPDLISLNNALLHLHDAFLITRRVEINCQLTKLGEFVSYLPFGTHIGRLVLYGVQFGIAHITVVLAAAIYKRIRPHKVPNRSNMAPDDFNRQMKYTFKSAWSQAMDGGRFSEPLMMLSMYRELRLLVNGGSVNQNELGRRCYELSLDITRAKAFVNLVNHIAATTKEAIAIICSESAANAFDLDFNTSLHMERISQEPVKTLIYTALLWSSDGNILRYKKPQSLATAEDASQALFTLQVDTAVVDADKIKKDLFPYKIAGQVDWFDLKRNVHVLETINKKIAVAKFDNNRFRGDVTPVNQQFVTQLITCRSSPLAWCSNEKSDASVVFAWMKDCLVVAAVTTADPTASGTDVSRVKSFLQFAVYASNPNAAAIANTMITVPYPARAGYSIHMWSQLPVVSSSMFQCVREAWRFGIKRYVELFSFPTHASVRLVIRTNGLYRFDNNELLTFCTRVNLPLQPVVDVSIPSFYAIDFRQRAEDAGQTCSDATMGFRLLNAYCIQDYHKRLMIHTKDFRGNKRIPWFVAVETKSVLTAPERSLRYQLPRYARWEGLSQRPLMVDDNDGNELEWQKDVIIDDYSYLATSQPFVQNHDEVSAIASSVALIQRRSGTTTKTLWECDQVSIVPYPACWLLAMMVIMSKGWLRFLESNSEALYQQYKAQCIKIRKTMEMRASAVIYNDQTLKNEIMVLQDLIARSNFAEKVCLWEWTEDEDGLPEVTFASSS